MDKQRYIEQILQDSLGHWHTYPVYAGGPIMYHDGDPTCDVGANLEKDEKPKSLYVRDTKEPLAILLTDKRVVTGWICDQPLIACTHPETEEVRYLTDSKEYSWKEVPSAVDDCDEFIESIIDAAEVAFNEEMGFTRLVDQDKNDSLEPIELPRLGDDALPPEDDRNSDGI